MDREKVNPARQCLRFLLFILIILAALTLIFSGIFLFAASLLKQANAGIPLIFAREQTIDLIIVGAGFALFVAAKYVK